MTEQRGAADCTVRMEPTWTDGGGAIRPKRHFACFKNEAGTAASSMPSWSWLCKHVDSTSIVVRWWVGESGSIGKWDEHHFAANELRLAKAKALDMAREHGWGATVHGRGWTHIGSSCTYDFLVIFEFGQWSKTTDRW